MDHPNRLAEMHGVNRAVGVSPVRQGDLVDAGPHALHGLDAARKPALCGGCQVVKDGVASALREILESLPRRLYPVDGPCVSNHRKLAKPLPFPPLRTKPAGEAETFLLPPLAASSLFGPVSPFLVPSLQSGNLVAPGACQQRRSRDRSH